MGNSYTITMVAVPAWLVNMPVGVESKKEKRLCNSLLQSLNSYPLYYNLWSPIKITVERGGTYISENIIILSGIFRNHGNFCNCGIRKPPHWRLVVVTDN